MPGSAKPARSRSLTGLLALRGLVAGRAFVADGETGRPALAGLLGALTVYVRFRRVQISGLRRRLLLSLSGTEKIEARGLGQYRWNRGEGDQKRTGQESDQRCTGHGFLLSAVAEGHSRVNSATLRFKFGH